MKVIDVSKETIEPSSPTLPPTETFRLSCLEKSSPLVYTPLLFFYPMRNGPDSNVSQVEEAIALLKNSLSETLCHFFFSEGKIDGTSICLNYEKVVFVKVTFDCGMSEILKKLNDEAGLLKLSIYSLSPEPEEKYVQIAIQANIFECGGLAISFCLLHELMDATTLSCFLRSWVSMNINSFRSFPSIVCSDFGPLSSLFDPRLRYFSSNSEQRSGIQRIELKEDAIPKLKKEVKSNEVDVDLNPTCVEVLIGFIWKCALMTRPTSTQSVSCLTHAINLRNKMPYSSPQFSVGNFWWVVDGQYFANNNTSINLSDLVKLLRESFEKINDDYIRGLVGENNGGAIAKLHERNDLLSTTPKLYLCTNWENMNFNEVYFGWGNAIWIGTMRDSNTTTNNIGILLHTVSNGELEIWIVLDQEEKNLLERNEEFCNFASLNVANIP